MFKGESVQDKKPLKEKKKTKLGNTLLDGCTKQVFHLTNSLQTMLKVVGQFEPGLKCLTYHEIHKNILVKDIEITRELVEKGKLNWVKFGFTIIGR